MIISAATKEAVRFLSGINIFDPRLWPSLFLTNLVRASVEQFLSGLQFFRRPWRMGFRSECGRIANYERQTLAGVDGWYGADGRSAEAHGVD